mmetsp:Transcript_4865/g.10745  ORF Transcript_4865/g.10745 Transcript_4865/m.10745 type:complete len:213 (-) Transcript_4865:478-1116(-)
MPTVSEDSVLGSGALTKLILASAIKSVFVTDPRKHTVILACEWFIPTANTSSSLLRISPTSTIIEDVPSSFCGGGATAFVTPPSIFPKSPPQNNSSNEKPPARHPFQESNQPPNMLSDSCPAPVSFNSLCFLLSSSSFCFCFAARCLSSKDCNALKVASCFPSLSTSFNNAASLKIMVSAVSSGRGNCNIRKDLEGSFNTPLRARSRSSERA